MSLTKSGVLRDQLCGVISGDQHCNIILTSYRSRAICANKHTSCSVSGDSINIIQLVNLAGMWQFDTTHRD